MVLVFSFYLGNGDECGRVRSIPNSQHEDWAARESGIMRACLVHALGLTKRTSNAKSPTILFLKNFLRKMMHEAGLVLVNQALTIRYCKIC